MAQVPMVRQQKALYGVRITPITRRNTDNKLVKNTGYGQKHYVATHTGKPLTWKEAHRMRKGLLKRYPYHRYGTKVIKMKRATPKLFKKIKKFLHLK